MAILSLERSLQCIMGYLLWIHKQFGLHMAFLCKKITNSDIQKFPLKTHFFVFLNIDSFLYWYVLIW